MRRRRRGPAVTLARCFHFLRGSGPGKLLGTCRASGNQSVAPGSTRPSAGRPGAELSPFFRPPVHRPSVHPSTRPCFRGVVIPTCTSHSVRQSSCCFRPFSCPTPTSAGRSGKTCGGGRAAQPWAPVAERRRPASVPASWGRPQCGVHARDCWGRGCSPSGRCWNLLSVQNRLTWAITVLTLDSFDFFLSVRPEKAKTELVEPRTPSCPVVTPLPAPDGVAVPHRVALHV